MEDSNPWFTRRTALKKGGLAVTALGVGLPIASRTASAEFPTLEVDAPPVISPEKKGEVVAAVYPEGDMTPYEVINHGDFAGFKLGPDQGPTTIDDVEPHADSVRHKLLPTGNLGVFFDPSTAETWFTSEDNEAKLSAIHDDNNERGIIAWGSDPVTVKATPSPN